MTFKKIADVVINNIPTTTYNSRESFHTLTSTGTANIPGYSGRTVPASFTLADGEGTRYDFSTIAWQSASHTAIPHYLLTRITDRWQREVIITWENVIDNGTAMRVKTVSCSGGPTLTLDYPNNEGLLKSVRLSTEPTGVTHSLGYTAVLDETGQASPKKLTSVTVRGPAGAATRSRTWQFDYLVDAATDSTAYSGSVTGDLVIRLTQPDGLVIRYDYEPVTLPRASSAD